MQPGSIPGEGTNDNHKGNTMTMTNTQLLTTADRALKDAARVFAAVADVRDPAGAMYQAAEDKLCAAAIDYAAVASAVNTHDLYVPDMTLRLRLETWQPSDDEGFADPEPAPDHDLAPPAAGQE